MPDLRPLRVAETTSQLLRIKHLKQQPAWYNPVSRMPPSTDLSRKPSTVPSADQVPGSLFPSTGSVSSLTSSPPLDATTTTTTTVSGSRRRGKKVKRLFEPRLIVYPEDRLRSRFYREHPWELARPVLLSENDGSSDIYRNARTDWSRGLRQPGRRVTGESVVQRWMYLMRTPVFHSPPPPPPHPTPSDVARKRTPVQFANSGEHAAKAAGEDGMTGPRDQGAENGSTHTAAASSAYNNDAAATKQSGTTEEATTKAEQRDETMENERHEQLERRRLMSEDEAYRLACSEFYAIRQRESIESRIAVEESLAFGAQLFPSQLEVGLRLEDKIVADWTERAMKQKTLRQGSTTNDPAVPAAAAAADLAMNETQSKKYRYAGASTIPHSSSGPDDQSDPLDELTS